MGGGSEGRTEEVKDGGWDRSVGGINGEGGVAENRQIIEQATAMMGWAYVGVNGQIYLSLLLRRTMKIRAGWNGRQQSATSINRWEARESGVARHIRWRGRAWHEDGQMGRQSLVDE